jgi:serine/threonine-protein kinase
MIGKTLAHYEITDLLGKGGMGEVYRARDTRLGREVAVKVLPREMSGDPERIARFEREARSLATLQHPNVASIYGFETVDNIRFLVMELVEGEDLSQLLARGSIPLEKAIEVARRIASGLEAAHDEGIVHRDLKPANVIATQSGDVKILDFGLARAFQSDPGGGADPMNSPTLTGGMTQAGVILGTAAYMSPEQARGYEVDRRADIWAFGVILYEMLSGHRLFAGETVSDTLAGVLKTEIDLDRLPAETPSGLRRLLERCLDRNDSTRLRDIGEARILLDQPLEEDAPTVKAFTGRRGGILAVIGLAGLIIGAVLLKMLSPSTLDVPPARQVRFSIPRDSESTPRSALSPDGSRFLFVNQNKLWIRKFDAMESREVPGTEGALVCTWSPDGEWIAFALAKSYYKIRPDGNGRTRLCEVDNDLHPWAGSIHWTEDDRIVFATGDIGLMSVSTAGGDAREVIAPEENETDFHHVHSLPGDRGFLFHPHVDLGFDSIHLFTGTERREILQIEGQQLNSAAYTSGHIVFMRTPDNPGIWAVPFSLKALEVTGEPFLVIPEGTIPTVSPQGDLAYVTNAQTNMQIVRIDENGFPTEEIGDAILGATELAVSPDGTRAVVVVEGDNYEIWAVDMVSGTRQLFMFSKDPIENLAWSADGLNIVYTAGMSDAELHQEIRAIDGSSSSAIGVRGNTPNFTRDQGTLVLCVWNEANASDIGYFDLEDPDHAVTMLANTQFAEENPTLSPDDRFVAYETVESGRREIVVRSFPDGEGRWQVSHDGGARPFWSPSGDRLYYPSLSNRWLHVVDVSRDPVRFSPPRRLYQIQSHRSIQAHPDGGFVALRMWVGQSQGGYEIWLNWADGLKAGR